MFGRSWRRFAVCAVVSATVVSGLAAAPASAQATHRSPGQVGAKVHVGRGVMLWHAQFRMKHQPERAVLLSVDLSRPGVRLAAVTARNQLNRRYQTIPSMGRMAGALAGINADFFDPTVPTGTARGGIVSNGVVLKTPQPGYERNFYVTRDGRAGIGAAPFTGTITASTGRTHSLYSLNTPSNAVNGSITLITPAYARADVTGCTVAYGHTEGATYLVDLVTVANRRLATVAPAHWVLAGCGASGAWLARQLHPLDQIGLVYGFSTASLQTLVSGGSVLLRNGKRYADPHGTDVGPGRNPETFICTSRNGRRVTLGVVDGRSSVSRGLTYNELKTYLKRLGCWSGLVLDGGGSSTLVARTPGKPNAKLQNQPSDHNGARRVTNGLFVFAP
jgi:hypothetical protein